MVRFVAADGAELGVDADADWRSAATRPAPTSPSPRASALRDTGAGSLVRALLLAYGVFDRRVARRRRARRFGGAGNMLTADEMEGFWRNYLARRARCE